jgi:hypothetical protein
MGPVTLQLAAVLARTTQANSWLMLSGAPGRRKPKIFRVELSDASNPSS